MAALTIAGCNAVLDFDDIEGLPCPCVQPGYVCLSASQTCERSQSVDDFKSCDINATPDPNDQCGEGSNCVDINGRGPRCLPRCTPLNPFVRDVGSRLADACQIGRYCFEGAQAGVGYCDDGVCNEFSMRCPDTQSCQVINSAGVCFSDCNIFDPATPCGPSATHCQPVAEQAVMACLATGIRRQGEVCGLDEGACAEGLICTRPLGSMNQVRTCAPPCNFNLGDADCEPEQGCFRAIPNVEGLGTDLGICQGG